MLSAFTPRLRSRDSDGKSSKRTSALLIYIGTRDNRSGNCGTCLNRIMSGALRLARQSKRKKLSEALAARGVEPRWTGCFSWIEVLHNPIGFFYPDLERVLHGLLFNRVKGLSAIFVQQDEFMQGKSGYSRLNSVLAWSLEKPDIESNLFVRTDSERTDLLSKELGKFLSVISELRCEYGGVKSRLSQATNKVKLDYNALEKSHCVIAFPDQMSYRQLLGSCEKARDEIRRFQEEIAVLRTVDRIIPTGIAPEYHLENPVEEVVAYLTLVSQPKYEVKEKRIREILRILGLPEDKVATIQKRGFRTEYKLIELRWEKPG